MPRGEAADIAYHFGLLAVLLASAALLLKPARPDAMGRPAAHS